MEGERNAPDRVCDAHLEIPTPSEERYSSMHPVAIQAVTSSHLIVVGNMVRHDGTPEGLVLFSEDGGRRWRRAGVEVHDLSRTTFQSVFFIDRVRGWIGGIRVDESGRAQAIVIRTEDGGNHWRKGTLPQDTSLIANDVHGLGFTSDREGTIAVTSIDPVTKQERETTFLTQDAGRSWVVSTWRQEPKQALYDQTQSFVDSKLGFRIVATSYPGVTTVETTGSGGQDWMPVCDLSLEALSTYY
jgi:photosystem II stability/assembly factor-like uncharacterized protein